MYQYWAGPVPCEHFLSSSVVLGHLLQSKVTMVDLLDWAAIERAKATIDEDRENRKKRSIAIIVPSTTRGLVRNGTVDHLPLFSHLLPSLAYTVESLRSSGSAGGSTGGSSIGGGSGGGHPPLSLSVFVGFDEGDFMYDDEPLRQMIVDKAMRILPGVSIQFVKCFSMEGKVVHLWNKLSSIAYGEGWEYYALLGDDVVLLTPGWPHRVMDLLRSNPFHENMGTVGIYDETHVPFFPSFPCFHRLHLDIFGQSSAFDSVFTNAYADPWISDVYVWPFHSAFLPSDIRLRNIYGGFMEQGKVLPRYIHQYNAVPLEQYVEAVQRARVVVARFLTANITATTTTTTAIIATAAATTTNTAAYAFDSTGDSSIDTGSIGIGSDSSITSDV
jgi:hypothetical protein